MISKYKNVAVIYGGKGRNYAEALHKSILKISDAVDWLISPTTRWFTKGSNHSLFVHLLIS